jgi:hypothetical protein
VHYRNIKYLNTAPGLKSTDLLTFGQLNKSLCFFIDYFSKLMLLTTSGIPQLLQKPALLKSKHYSPVEKEWALSV